VPRERLIAELEKPAAREILRVRETRLGEREVLDVRVYYLDEDIDQGTAEWKPTRRGIALSRETWRELLAVIAEALAEDDPRQPEVYQ